jgi:hypothetical protein
MTPIQEKSNALSSLWEMQHLLLKTIKSGLINQVAISSWEVKLAVNK